MKIIKNEQLNLSRLLRGIKNGWLLLGLFLLVGLPAHAQLPTSPHPDANWNLNWSEDFTPDTTYSSSNYINPNKWFSAFDWNDQFTQTGSPADSPEIACLASNFKSLSFIQLSPTNWAAELKATKNTPRKDTVIKFRYTDAYGHYHSDTSIVYPCEYTIQVISTRQTFGYGYYELRMKYPSPAGGGDTNIGFSFWSYAANFAYNIGSTNYYQVSGSDIEMDFKRAYYELDMSSSIINGTTLHNVSEDSIVNPYNIPASGWGAFHTYGLERDPGYIAYYVDGNLVYSSTNKDLTMGQPDTIPALALNLSYLVPSNDFHALPVKIPSNTTMPFIITIDYLHFYKLNCDTSVSINSPTSYTFNSSNFTSVKKLINIGGSSSAIPASTNVSMRAKNIITFQPGFSVPVTSTLYANTCGCK